MSNKEAVNNVIQERLSHQVIGPILLSVAASYWEVTVQILDVTTKANERIDAIKKMSDDGIFDARWVFVFLAGFFYLFLLPLVTEIYETYFRQFSTRKLAEELKAKRIAEWDANVGRNIERIAIDYKKFVTHLTQVYGRNPDQGLKQVYSNLLDEISNKKASLENLVHLPPAQGAQHLSETVRILNSFKKLIENAIKPKKPQD